MTPDTPQPPLTCFDLIKGVHIVYCEESGNALRLTNHIQDQWSRWLRNEWTADDMRCVIRYIRRRYYDRNRPQIMQGMLRFRNLVEPEYNEAGMPHYTKFESLLCDARADQRNQVKPKTNRDQALASLTTGSAEVGSRVVDGVKPAGMTAQQIVEGLQKWKQENL